MKKLIKKLKLKWKLWRLGITDLSKCSWSDAEGVRFGSYSFHYRGKNLKLYAGPYACKPEDYRLFGICLDANMARIISHDHFIDWPDFGVPQMKDLVEAVDLCLEVMMEGKAVYIGCLGGIGRTGTFLACLAKRAGKKDPIKSVRQIYLARAVETQEQAAFVDAFE